MQMRVWISNLLGKQNEKWKPLNERRNQSNNPSSDSRSAIYNSRYYLKFLWLKNIKQAKKQPFWQLGVRSLHGAIKQFLRGIFYYNLPGFFIIWCLSFSLPTFYYVPPILYLFSMIITWAVWIINHWPMINESTEHLY